MITAIKSPFDLPAIKASFFVVVPALAAALMERSDEDGGSKEEREAIWQIYGLLQKAETGEEMGFSLPHQYGLSYPERKLTAESMNSQLNLQIRAAELIQRISSETKVSPEEIKDLANNDPESFGVDERFAPYTAELLGLKALEDEIVEHGRAITTAYMRCRLGLKEWTLAHSEALHNLIYNQIMDFYHEEESLASEAGKQIQTKRNPSKAA